MIGTVIINGALAVTLLITLTLAYFIIDFIRQKIQLRSFNGPRAFPLIGNCYDPALIYFVKYIATLRKNFGKVFTLFTFTKGMLVVCDPIVVRRVLSDSKTFYKGHDYTDCFSRVFGEGLVTSNHERHKKDRATFGKFFVRSNIGKFAEVMNSLTKKGFAQEIVVPAGGSLSINIEKFFAKLALRNFMQFSMSTDISDKPELEHEVCEIVSLASGAVGRLIVYGLPAWSFLPEVKIMDKFNKVLRKVFQDLKKERQEALKRGECQDIDDCLSVLLKENMSDKIMEDHFKTLVAAGHDTTAFFLSYITYLLATHPLIQEKLYNHITEKLGGRVEVTLDDLAELKYMSYVMMETLRLYAVVPMISRVSAEEVHIKEANITIPKNTNILVPIIVMNRDPSIWENPSEFRPERFEEKSSDYTSARDGYFPFGYGLRTCIGNAFAQIEAGITLCHLLRRYKIEEAPNFSIKIAAGISLTTTNGVQVILKERF